MFTCGRNNLCVTMYIQKDEKTKEEKKDWGIL